MITTSTRQPFLFCFVFLLFTLPTTLFGLNVRFYDGFNNTGFYHEVSSFSGDCARVDGRYSPVKGSIKTDTCIMVYVGDDCRDYSAKILPGSRDFNIELIPLESYKAGYFLAENKWLGIRSFSPCHKTVGGPELIVDLYYDQQPKYEFNNLCTCRNLPSNFHSPDSIRRISGDNHGNPFKVYSETDCQGQSTVVPAGDNCYSRDLTNFSPEDKSSDYHPIKSIGPYRRSQSYQYNCLSLTSSIYKFEFLDSYVEGEQGTIETVEMATKTVFKNNGTAKLTQEYKISKSVSESAEVTVANSLSDMHKGVVELKVAIEGGAEIPFLASGKVTNELKTAYEYTHTSATTDTKRTVIQNSREFSVRQQIEVPPCTEYSVSSFVNMVKDKELEYKVYSKVTGELGGERMTATQIRDHIDGTLEIVGDADEYGVLVEAKAVMTATYGLKSFIYGQGNKIVGCELKRKRNV